MTEPSRPDLPALARGLLRLARFGTLATIDADGRPFATLVNLASDADGAPISLVSSLSTHTRHLARDGRASLLVQHVGRTARGRGDPLAHPRLTVLADAAPTREPRARERFLRRHPKSALYADFADFSFWRFEVAGLHLNGGFGRAGEVAWRDVVTDLSDARPLLDAEGEVLARLNADPARLRAAAGADEGAWTATGLDPDGLDLVCGEGAARVAFPRRLVDPAAVEAFLRAV